MVRGRSPCEVAPQYSLATALPRHDLLGLPQDPVHGFLALPAALAPLGHLGPPGFDLCDPDLGLGAVLDPVPDEYGVECDGAGVEQAGTPPRETVVHGWEDTPIAHPTRVSFPVMAEIPLEERRELEDEGDTAYGTSYPIRDCKDLENAIRAYGRAPESKRAELRRFIVRRKAELGCPGVEIPETWHMERRG